MGNQLINSAALVLEGGGFRGMFTAGVLDAFLQNELHFGYVIGVSAGADYGASYVSRQFGRNLEVNEFVSDPNYCSWFHLLTKGEYFNDHFVYRYLPEKLVPFDFDTFAASGVTMKAGLTDFESGQAEYKLLDATDRKRFAALLSATSSLPLLAKPKYIDNRLYMDGGIADSIPVEQALTDGNKRLVIVLTRDAGYRKEPFSYMPFWKWYYRGSPRFVEALKIRHEQYNRTLDYIRKLEAEGRAYVIRPSEPLPVSRMENKPKQLAKVYEMGLRQMQAAINQLITWIEN